MGRLTAVLRPHQVVTSSLLSLAVVSGGCASHSQTVSVAAPQRATSPAPVLVAGPTSLQLVTDPIADLIAISNSQFDAGQTELRLGHLDSARGQVNKAVDRLLG